MAPPSLFAESGRWAPPQFALLNRLPPENVIRPDTTTLDYAQAGLRFTTTIAGAADIGAQYYYGRMSTPAVTMTADTPSVATFAYNPYHQIGLDYAQVIAGFNLRAELAANITEDLSGDDGGVYNPSLAWSLGFDRDLFAGVNLNLQCGETIRLLDGEITAPQDIEADSDITSVTNWTSKPPPFGRWKAARVSLCRLSHGQKTLWRWNCPPVFLPAATKDFSASSTATAL